MEVNFQKLNWDFKLQRGELLNVEDMNAGDFFYEYSDTLPTSPPSTTPFSMVPPTIRMGIPSLKQAIETKNMRNTHTAEVWADFKDLTIAYIKSDKPIIEKLVVKVLKDVYPSEVLGFNHDLDYQKQYFLVLNFLVFPWIDFEDHAKFVKWVSHKVLNKKHLANSGLVDFTAKILTPEYCTKIKNEIADLTIRFADLRDYFFYSRKKPSKEDFFVSNQGFLHLKTFYTDCFEFLGRTSHLILRLQNLFERGSQDAMPSGTPKDVVSASVFSAKDHGQKKAILLLSRDAAPKTLYTKAFDHRLRNGINHYKAHLDESTQLITYYPSTKNPEQGYFLKYLDFLDICLDAFNSVLKVGQLVKVIIVHRTALEEGKE